MGISFTEIHVWVLSKVNYARYTHSTVVLLNLAKNITVDYTTTHALIDNDWEI